uniref:Uncharacterized protein n=1 Tax=Oryza brachyantha TaxID=4533 RepID=J3M7Y4_ORYBR
MVTPPSPPPPPPPPEKKKENLLSLWYIIIVLPFCSNLGIRKTTYYDVHQGTETSQYTMQEQRHG